MAKKNNKKEDRKDTDFGLKKLKDETISWILAIIFFMLSIFFVTATISYQQYFLFWEFRLPTQSKDLLGLLNLSGHLCFLSLPWLSWISLSPNLDLSKRVGLSEIFCKDHSSNCLMSMRHQPC